jgi:hypothetical protein
LRSNMGPRRKSDVSDIRRRLQATLRKALGRRCWHVSVGGVTLPTFSIALGRKVPRERPLRNRKQPKVFREFQGEVSLLVWCVWRLDRRDRVVVSSDGRDSQIVKGLDCLLAKSLLRIKVVPPAWDLTLTFSDGYTLRVFCNHAGDKPTVHGNWQARVVNRRVSVGPGESLQMTDGQTP